MTEKSFLFLGQESYHKGKSGMGGQNNTGDKAFLPYLKPLAKGHRVFIDLKPITTLYEVEAYCKDSRRNITGVLSTSIELLSKLTGKAKPSLDSYAGSYFNRNGIEYVFVDPLEQCVTLPYGRFLLARFSSKLFTAESWLTPTNFNWKVLNGRNSSECNSALEFLNSCELIAEDIETFSDPLSIRCVGYTGARLGDDGVYATFSYVLPIDCMEAVHWMRRFNSTPGAKIFQNGKYDLSYLAHYGAPVTNYLWDTANLFHSWYSELPKDLAFLQAFFVREASYWKDLAQSNDLETYYLYNAKDTWATLNVFLAWIHQAPDWARRNYTLEFPLVFPCHLSEMTGLKRDVPKMEVARTEVNEMVAKKSAQLDRLLGVKNFNVNSPIQMKQLMKTLCGASYMGGADDKAIAKAAYQHPLNGRILGVIRGIPKTDNVEKMGIRALRKVASTYLNTGTDSKEYKGRVLYALNPHGTDTSRLASKEHHFWCGLQVQNIPVGKTVKQTICADEGFYLGEADLEQAETRDTAYITGDKNLIAAVNSSRDFHSSNVEAFFGLPYETIYDDARKKTLNKPIRDIGKRVNHGANYNMGPDVLVDTMGEEQIYAAAALLKLPRSWTAREIASHLLSCFDKTYPVIRGDYQKWVKEQVLVSRMLVGALGWTRYCFDDPSKSKPALNAYVAHSPQSLNAQVLNKAYMKVFYDIAMNPAYKDNFKLCAQIHDSILFQYREGHEYLAEMVRERMEIPITIKDIKGIERTFTVPAALKLGKPDAQGNLVRSRYWSETE
jgi:DNA polymerase I-like protein with 3'-5' exonuclease and polymerase domains